MGIKIIWQILVQANVLHMMKTVIEVLPRCAMVGKLETAIYGSF